MLKVFKDFFACKIVLAANHLYLENIQRLFWQQNCLSRKSSLSWKHSKTFLPAKLSSTQIIIMLKVFKDFFACKIVFDANHHYPENIQRLFRLQNWLRCKSSLSWKHSKTFSPAKVSSTQIIIILKRFKHFFACIIVFDANHHYPENIQRLFRLQYCLRCKSSLSWKHSTNFPLANCLGRKSSLSWKYSKTFSLANCLSRKSSLYWNYSKIFWLQNCLNRKSSLSWKHSKTFSPAKVSSTQIIIMLKVFKDFFACKIVLAANHLYLENIQRLFDCKSVLAANHQYPENIQRLFWLQKCLSRKSSLSWKHPETFLPAKLSSTQIIIMLKVFKDFFACKIVFDANHHYPENIQRLFRLQ